MKVKQVAESKQNKAAEALTPFKELGRDEQLAIVNDLLQNLPPLKKVLTSRQAAWRKHNVNAEGMCDRRNRLTENYTAYSCVLKETKAVLDEGGDVNAGQLRRNLKVRSGLSVRSDTVSKWLNKKPPKFLSHTPAEDVAVIPSTEDPDFAFFISFVVAQKGGVPDKFIRVSNADKNVVTILRVEAKRLLGKTPANEDLNPFLRSEGLYSFNVACPKVLDYVKTITDGKKQLAWGHIKTPDERLWAARGFLAANSSVVDRGGPKVRPLIRMSKEFSDMPAGEEPRLFVDVEILLGKLGVTSSLWKSKTLDKWYLDIEGLNNLRRVMAIELLPEPKHKRLEMFFRRRGEETIRSFTPEQYRAAMKYKEVSDRLQEGKPAPGWKKESFYADVARNVNKAMKKKTKSKAVIVTDEVDGGIVRSWLVEERVPPSVQDIEKLNAIAEKEKKLYKSVDAILRGIGKRL